jgi:hypothetical protein
MKYDVGDILANTVGTKLFEIIEITTDHYIIRYCGGTKIYHYKIKEVDKDLSYRVYKNYTKYRILKDIL